MTNGKRGVSAFLLLAPILFQSLFGNFNFDSYIFIKKELFADCNTVDSLYFAPDDGLAIEALLLHLIKVSKKISGALYLLNRKKIIDQLVEAHSNGAQVELLFDQGALDGGSKNIFILPKNGIPLYIYDSDLLYKFRPLMHNKFLLFENKDIGLSVVASGSMNLTQSGLFRNQDNISFRNNVSIFESYKKQFEIIKKRTNAFQLTCIKR